MSTKFSIVAIAGGLSLLFGSVANAALPDSGVDYSEIVGTVSINTVSTANPNILRTVTVTCPKRGYVVASAVSQIKYSAGASFPGTIAFNISKNSKKFQNKSKQTLFGNYINGLHTASISLQRVDQCKAGQKLTFRFLATLGSNAGNASATNPSLVVSFFANKL